MKNVFLINTGKIPHYRVPVYGYLYEYLKIDHYHLTIISEGIQGDSPHNLNFDHIEVPLSFSSLAGLLLNRKPDGLIFWLGPHFYMLPVLLLSKLMNMKIIHWGHRRPLPPHMGFKKIVYGLEHWMDDAIIIYSEQLRMYICSSFQSKTFVANNTLHIEAYEPVGFFREDVRRKYGIYTKKNILCMGRVQKRKRINYLVKAFRMLNIEDVGLILAGPDDEGILKDIEDRNIYKLGPVYGKESLELLNISDLYCLPGSIGLSIVDAFWAGLPVVTESVIHGPEIMYLKDGINGFIVPEGDIGQYVDRIRLLLTDDALRERFSEAARSEIMTSGHIDRMCEGFKNALHYVLK